MTLEQIKQAIFKLELVLCQFQFSRCRKQLEAILISFTLAERLSHLCKEVTLLIVLRLFMLIFAGSVALYANHIDSMLFYSLAIPYASIWHCYAAPQ